MHWLLALLFGWFHPTPYDQMVARTTASIVRITGVHQSDDGFQPYVCTGFVIRESRILTAGHCAGLQMRADGQEATPLKLDFYYDLLLLKVHTDKPALSFNEDSVSPFRT